ncbi:hypothetical protein ACKKBF_B19640 [Auxenochlorella protothecoides x Auxenochlorella symbiontica]
MPQEVDERLPGVPPMCRRGVSHLTPPLSEGGMRQVFMRHQHPVSYSAHDCIPRPRMAQASDVDDMEPLLLTAKLDPASRALFTGLRTKYFPAERNYLDAHLTLFHKLDRRQEAAVRRDVASACSTSSPMVIPVLEPVFLGKGVALRTPSKPLDSLRARLAGQWKPWLTPQDRQGHRAHITIQNKVSPEEARGLFDELRGTWQPHTLTVQGLELHIYKGGPWELLEAYDFGA